MMVTFLLATAQVLLRWATQRGIAVILGGNNYYRLVGNLDFDISESDSKEISALNISLRVSFFHIPDRPYSTDISLVE